MSVNIIVYGAEPMDRCPHCKSKKIHQLKSTTGLGYKQFRCHDCAKQFNERTGMVYNFLEFPTDVVMLNKIIDPIYIGSQIVQAIQSIVSRSSLPTDAVVISVSQFHAGTVFNVMPDEAQLNGTIRTTTTDSQKNVLEKMKQLVHGIAETFGAAAEIEFYHHFPPTINPVNEAEFVLKTAKKVVGEKNVSVLTDPSMASEDFSHYLQKIPGCFFFLGNGNHGAIHSAQYQFNDEIIPVAAEMLAQVAMDYLN